MFPRCLFSVSLVCAHATQLFQYAMAYIYLVIDNLVTAYTASLVQPHILSHPPSGLKTTSNTQSISDCSLFLLMEKLRQWI